MKHKLLAIVLTLVTCLCLCLGPAACGSDKNDGHEHIYTAENKCSVCGKEWKYTKSDALEYTKVVLNGVEGYDVRFGEYLTVNPVYDDEGNFVQIEEKTIGTLFEGEEVVFPYGYNGLPVISIGRFYPCYSETVKSITVPKSVFSFGRGRPDDSYHHGSFRCSALEKLDLPDGLPVLTRQTISWEDPSAAYPMVAYTLFDGIVDLGKEVCPLYDDPQYRENGALYIGNYLFETDFEEPVDTFTVKDGTKVVLSIEGAKHVVLPDSVEIIADNAFSRGKTLESVTVGSGIEEIGDFAFYFTNLTNITLPDKPIYIGSFAFENTPLMMNDANWEYSDEEGDEGSYEFRGRYLYIGNHLIDASLRTDGSSIFTMKPELKSIAYDAFFDVYHISELRIPSIEAWFKVRRGGGMWQVWKLIVDGQETTEIDIPSSVKEIPDYALCFPSLTRVTIPNSVTSIGSCAFLSCSGLTNIAIPDSVTSIGSYAFSECGNLTNITIPNSVTSIGESVFYNCRNLTNITIPNSVTSIGMYAFYNCGLTSITIPNSVTSIGSYAFSECWNLTNITIPDSVTSIGSFAFWGCKELTDIQFKGTVQAWQAIEKSGTWDVNTGEYTITCTNGKIAKDGTVTHF